jgi:maleylpyruvate isomerase
MNALGPTALSAFVRDSVGTFSATLDALDPASLGAPSTLPGWSRAHVAAHVDGVGRAIARQLEYARSGERIEFYDGGQQGRDERIEAGAALAPQKLLSRVREGLMMLVEAVHDVPADGWDTPTSFRGEGTVADCVQGAWRETLIHAADLAGRSTPADWPTEFAAHLFDFLSARVPAGTRLVLQPTGRPPVTLGIGANGCVVTGMETDLAAWLAGREPVGPVRAAASADASELPALRPWPSALTPRDAAPQAR